MKAKAKYVELITEVKKTFRYVGNDGEVFESKNPKEFIKLLQGADAPTKRAKGDNSVTAFDFICNKLKMNAIALASLNASLLIEDTISDEDYDEDETEDNKSLSDLSFEEIQDLLPE